MSAVLSFDRVQVEPPRRRSRRSARHAPRIDLIEPSHPAAERRIEETVQRALLEEWMLSR